MLFYLIISIFVGAVLALVKTKKSYFIFGFLVLALGMLILNYSYSLEKPKIEDYPTQQITYNKFWLDENEKAVVLESDCCRYLLSYKLIKKPTTIDEVVSVLDQNTNAKIWLLNTKNENRKILRGMEIQNLHIPVTTGMVLDDPSNYLSIGWLFVVLGGIIIVLTFFFGKMIVSSST